MTDPVAEAAAQIAAAQPTMLERAMETIHTLEAKVEHLIHPDTPGNVNAIVEASVTAPATDEGAGTPGEPVTAEDAVAPSAEPSTTQPTSPPVESAPKDGISEPVEAGNVDTSPTTPAPDAAAPTSSAASDAPQLAAELPNVVPVAAEFITAPASAPSAAGADITSSTAASSDEPLHTRIAAHLEAIYTLAKDHTIATETAATRAAATTKTHIGDILHRMSNGMAVTEGELVSKLEALYRML